MGVRYSKSIKVGNYLKLNFSKNGVSATVGKKGASVNLGSKGAYLNLSPSAVGLNGTGVSYRQKIFSLNSGKKKKGASTKEKEEKKTTTTSEKTSSLKKNDSVKEELKDEVIQEEVYEETELDPVEEYELNHEAIVNLHKYAAPVMDKAQFLNYVEEEESEAKKTLLNLAAEGDEDIIENMVSSFMNNLELAYDVRVNYELEDDVLYVDLDLPEIEELQKEYPAYNNGRIVTKRKTSSALKEEYARLVLSLGIFLAANYFNLSSYIQKIVMSGFTTVRDKNGDQIDQYIYSVKFDRDLFENTDLSQVDDPYQFVLKSAENRINMSDAFAFKAIKPYEMESSLMTNELVEDAIAALKELGYKPSDLNAIKERLSANRYENSSDYLKEGLRLLKEKNQ